MLLHFEEPGLLSSALFDPRVALPHSCSVLCSLLLQPWLGWFLLLCCSSGHGSLPPAPESFPASSQLGFSSANGRVLPIFVTVNKPWVVFLILFLACSWCVAPLFIWNAECIISNNGTPGRTSHLCLLGCSAAWEAPGQCYSTWNKKWGKWAAWQPWDTGVSPWTSQVPGQGCPSGLQDQAGNGSSDCGGQPVGCRGGGKSCTNPCRQKISSDRAEWSAVWQQCLSQEAKHLFIFIFLWGLCSGLVQFPSNDCSSQITAP